MKDLINAKHVELIVDDQNKVWLNIDGQCVVRVGRAEDLRIEVAGMFGPTGKEQSTIIERSASE